MGPESSMPCSQQPATCPHRVRPTFSVKIYSRDDTVVSGKLSNLGDHSYHENTGNKLNILTIRTVVTMLAMGPKDSIHANHGNHRNTDNHGNHKRWLC